MPLADLFPLLRRKPARVAVVYESRERALDAASAAKGAAATDDVRVVGPLERLLGNGPAHANRGGWAVVVQPKTYVECSRIARALRHPWRRRSNDEAVAAKPEHPAVGLAVDRS